LRRLKRHPESRSIIFKVLIVLIMLFSVSVVTLICLVLFTGMCKIENVVVNGAKQLSPEYIKELSGISTFSNVVTLPAGKIRGNLLREVWVRDARVRKKLFHTVIIDISERQPIAIIKFGDIGFLVDKEGVVIGRAEDLKEVNLPFIEAENESSPKPGEKAFGKELLESIRVLGSLSENLYHEIEKVCPYDKRGTVFVSRSDYQIVYGSGFSKKKNEILEAIIADIKNNGRRVAYLDIRVPECPVVMPK